MKITHHESAKGNHNAVLSERVNRFINEGLTIFNNERQTNRCFLVGVKTLLYAWNTAPRIGTDISRSLVVTGREWQFPIDIINDNITELNVSEQEVTNFTSELKETLKKNRFIYALLIEEHRKYHREYRNLQLQEKKKINEGDIVFSKTEVQSSKAKGVVRKLSFDKRGPYQIV